MPREGFAIPKRALAPRGKHHIITPSAMKPTGWTTRKQFSGRTSPFQGDGRGSIPLFRSIPLTWFRPYRGVRVDGFGPFQRNRRTVMRISCAPGKARFWLGIRIP